MDLKGRLVLVPLTIQIGGKNNQTKDYMHFSTPPPQGKLYLSSNLVWPSGIQDTRYHVLIVYVHFLCQPSPRKKSFLTHRPPRVHEPVLPLIWAALVDLTISVLSEIQN